MFSEEESAVAGLILRQSQHTTTGAPLVAETEGVNKITSGEIYKLSIDRDEL
jgi:hypothetical protein